MDKNLNLYNAAWHLVYASRLVNKYETDMAKDLLEKADVLSKQINVNEEEEKEIDKYEELLRETT